MVANAITVSIANSMKRGAETNENIPLPSMVHRLYMMVSTPIPATFNFPTGIHKQITFATTARNRNTDCLRCIIDVCFAAYVSSIVILLSRRITPIHLMIYEFLCSEECGLGQLLVISRDFYLLAILKHFL